MSQAQSSKVEPQFFDISKIVTDAGTQMRETINPQTVDGYAEILHNGGTLPPLLVFHDPASNAHHLVEGFHRIAAHQKLGHKVVPVEIRPGTLREAKLHAIGDNATHGLPRTNGDKRKAVASLLTDTEWSKFSDSEIARRALVSQPFVSGLRKEFSPPVERTVDTSTTQVGATGSGTNGDGTSTGSATPERTVTRGGKQFKMKAGNQHSKKRQAAKAMPFNKFNDRMRAALALIRSASKAIKQVAEYNAETAVFVNVYAKYLSPTGTVVALDKLALAVEQNLPGDMAEGEPGFITQVKADAIAAKAKAAKDKEKEAAEAARVKAGPVKSTLDAIATELTFKAKQARKASDKAAKASAAKPADAGLKATAESYAADADKAEKLALDARDKAADEKAKKAGTAPTGATPTAANPTADPNLVAV